EAVDRRSRECHQQRRVGRDDELALPGAGHLPQQRQQRQLALLREMTGAGESQFIIATHSPLLMAFPGATIYSLDDGTPRRVAWCDLEHVTLTRDFLNDPDTFLRRLAV
ncbi:MAG TPA: hypothetical protein VHG52_10685, partial [Thermomicrobiales bacterium]|nr:hypothetical protein [Thermomicrobiales bacterium]